MHLLRDGIQVLKRDIALKLKVEIRWLGCLDAGRRAAIEQIGRGSALAFFSAQFLRLRFGPVVNLAAIAREHHCYSPAVLLCCGRLTRRLCFEAEKWTFLGRLATVRLLGDI